MAKKKKQTIGYKYFASAHFVLCHGPIDAITKISFQDKDAYLNEENSNKTIYINKPSLFGGDEQSGGVQGNIELLFGRAEQQKSSVLQRICAKISNAFGGLISAYRGVCSVVFDNVYIGTAPNMPDSKWRVKRIHTRHDGQQQWYDEKAEIREIIIDNSADILSPMVPPPNVTMNYSMVLSEPWGDYSGTNPKHATYNNTELSFTVGGVVISGIQDPKPSSQLTATINLPVGHYKGIAYLYSVDDGEFYMTGSSRIDSTSSYEKYEIDFYSYGVEEPAFVCHISGANTTSIGIASITLQKFFSKYGGVTGDINPTHIIRECLTNPIWGIGVSESNIDDTSFKKAADVLFEEGMGMSIKWTDSTSINEFVDNIKEHINAQLYLDRVTNTWKLYLIRDDYDVSDLISLDESNIRNLDFERRTLAECVNSVTVTYWDRERAKDSTVTIQDIARIAQQGGVISQSIDYKGFTNSNIAGRIALRDLKTLSSTLASVSFDVDESFSESWHEGMPFKLSDESYGLSEAVMRIRTIKRGDGINNTVYVEAIEDSFSSPMQSVVEYVPPITSGDSTAKNATAIAFEVPYIELVEQYGQDEVDAKLSNYPDLGYVGMAAIRPNNQHVNARLYVDAGAGYDERTTLDFCPSASLKTDIGYVDSSFEIQNVAEFELLEVNHRIQVGDEIMAFVSFDTAMNVLTVKRGCFDTVPQQHNAGAKIFGWDNYSGIDNLEYLNGEALSLKALTLTGSDVLELSEAATHSLILSGRAIRPYPPANVKINNIFMPSYIEDDLLITWSDRNRLQETGGAPLGYFESSIALEENTQTLLTIVELDANDIELATHSINVTAANSFALLKSAMQANTRSLQVSLKTVRDGYECLNVFNHIVKRTTLTPPSDVEFQVIKI